MSKDRDLERALGSEAHEHCVMVQALHGGQALAELKRINAGLAATVESARAGDKKACIQIAHLFQYMQDFQKALDWHEKAGNKDGADRMRSFIAQLEAPYIPTKEPKEMARQLFEFQDEIFPPGEPEKE